MLRHLLAQRRGTVDRALVLERVVARRRRRRGLPEQVVEDPLAALHGRRARRVGGDGQHAAVAQQAAAAARVAGEHRAHERVAVALVGQPVELREARVDEGVVGVQQPPHVLAFGQHRPEQQLGLARHRGPQVVGERVARRIGPRRRERAQLQPLPGEVRREPLGAPILQHAVDLAFERSGIDEPALARRVQQRFVGRARPQEIGEPGRERRCIELALVGRLDTEEEPRRRERRREHEPLHVDQLLAVRQPLLRRGQQPGARCVLGRAPPQPRQRRVDEPLDRVGFVGDCRSTQRRDPVLRCRDHARVHGPFDRQRHDVEVAVALPGVGVLGVVVVVDERGGDRVAAG